MSVITAPRGTSKFNPFPLIIDGDTYYSSNNKQGEKLPDDISDISQLIAEDFVKDDHHTNNGTTIYVLNWDEDDYNCLEVMLYDYGITCVERFMNDE